MYEIAQVQTGHIFIYGYIGANPGEVSIKNVQAQLAKEQADEYVVHMVSGGGDVFEGFGIYNILRNTGKKITTHIEGMCASISTLIAFAGDKIIMDKTSQFMIHNPSIADLKGDSRVLRNMANQLDKIKSLLLEVSSARAARNGKPIQPEVLSGLYDKETYLTAVETQQYGFADEVQNLAIKAVAKINVPMENNLFNKFLGWFKIKFKNQMTETLEDGRVIVVMADSEDWTGAQVVLETGEPLPAGEHKLAGGKIIVLDDTSTITEVKLPEAPPETPPPADTQTEEEKEMENKKIAELEAEIKELKAQKTTAEATAQSAQKMNAQFENRMEALEKKLADASTTTVGDKTPLGKGPAFKNASEAKRDPMGDYAVTYYKNRNIIPNEEA